MFRVEGIGIGWAASRSDGGQLRERKVSTGAAWQLLASSLASLFCVESDAERSEGLVLMSMVILSSEHDEVLSPSRGVGHEEGPQVISAA